MNLYTKSFGISLALHTLMALLALSILTMMHRPSESFALPLKHMTLVSLTPTQKLAAVAIEKPIQPAQSPSPAIVKSPHKPAPKPLVTQSTPLPKPITPSVPKSLSASVQPAPAAEARHTTEAPSPTATASVPAKISSPPLAAQKVDINAEKKSFFAHLRTTIQQHLRYPSAARRRGMEGEVNVRFVLENSGTVREINIRQGEAIFHNAAKLAVASASGIKIPDTLSGAFPAEIELMLEFRLNESL